MATETILIDFQVDNAGLKASIDQLVKMGVITIKDAEAYKRITTNVNESKRAIDGASTSTRKLGDESRKTKGAFEGINNTLKNIGRSIGAAFALGALVAFGKEAAATAAKVDSIRNALNFVAGSKEGGAQTFQFLTDLSKRLGLELLSTAQAFKLFSASAQLSGISGDETKKIFEQVSTAVTALGLSSDDAQGVFLALSQVISKGTVAAEELRGQIGERLPGAFELAAKSMGVTTKELNKLLEQGKVTAKDFLPGFAEELEKTFGKALPEAVNSAQANANRLSNIFTELSVGVGRSVNSLLAKSGIIGALQLIADSFETTEERLQKLRSRGVKDATAGIELEVDALVKIGKTRLEALDVLAKDYKERIKDILHDPTVGADNTTFDAIQDNITAIELLIKSSKENIAVKKEDIELTKEQIAAYKAIRDEWKKFVTDVTQLNERLQMDRNTEDLKEFLEKKIKTEREAEEDITKFEDDENQRRLALRKQFVDDSISEREREREAAIRIEQEIADAEVELQLATLDFIGQLSQQAADNELAILQDKRKKGLITEQQFQDQSKVIKRNAAAQQKAIALFEAFINVANAITRALATNPLLVPLAAALGAVQIAAIAARPIPKFKHGTLNLRGGTGGIDDIPILANRGEAIIPTDTNRAYHTAIAGIYNKKIPASYINAITDNYIKNGGKESAGVNPWDFKHVMSGMPMTLKNADAIGKSIAKHIPQESSIVNRRLGNGL